MKPAVGYSNRPASDSSRDVEAWALIEAARRLLRASQTPDDHDQLRSALIINQRLWTIFQASVTEDDCPLPPELRNNVLMLSMIVDQDTFARLADMDVTKLDRLIDINRQLASGLSMRPEDAANQAAAGQSATASTATPAQQPPAPPPPVPPAMRGYGARPAAPQPAAAPRPGDGGKVSISI